MVVFSLHNSFRRAYKARLPVNYNARLLVGFITLLLVGCFFIILHKSLLAFEKNYRSSLQICIFFQNMQFYTTKSRLYIMKDQFAIEVSDDIR